MSSRSRAPRPLLHGASPTADADITQRTGDVAVTREV
jgi:hypothetical protein